MAGIGEVMPASGKSSRTELGPRREKSPAPDVAWGSQIGERKGTKPTHALIPEGTVKLHAKICCLPKARGGAIVRVNICKIYMPQTGRQSLNTSKVLCVIMGGGQGTRLFPLTKERAKPAVPLAGKYRLVDIPISNCINSGFRRVYILTQFNSASLHSHISRTYKFDQFTTGFVEILAAQQTLNNTSWYEGTADAVRKNLVHFLSHDFDQLVILSGDQLYRMDFRPLIAQHTETGADITVATIPVNERRGAIARHPANRRRPPHHALRRKTQGPRGD